MTTTTDTLVLPDAPPIPGVRFRHFRDVADFESMARVGRAANLHDQVGWIPSAAALQIDYENTTDLVPSRDIVLVEVDGTVVAYGCVFRQVRDGLGVYQTAGQVHPDWRRRGIGRALLHANEARIRELAAGFEDPEGRAFGAWCDDAEGGARPLLLSEGYTPVRYGFTMLRPNLDDIPDAPLPAGLEIRPVLPEHHRRIWDANTEAFRDHWNHREPTEEDFRAFISMPDLDTSLWSVAWDRDEVVGSVLTMVWKEENEALGVRRAWLERISVRRPWRRRGVARAIIADALRRLRAIGIEDAMLGVDSENPNGALHLYESIGFAVKDPGATYRKPFEPGGRLY